MAEIERVAFPSRRIKKPLGRRVRPANFNICAKTRFYRIPDRHPMVSQEFTTPTCWGVNAAADPD